MDGMKKNNNTEDESWSVMAARFHETTASLLSSSSSSSLQKMSGGSVHLSLLKYQNHCRSCLEETDREPYLNSGEWGSFHQEKLKRLRSWTEQERNTWMLLSDFYCLENELWRVRTHDLQQVKGSILNIEAPDGSAFLLPSTDTGRDPYYTNAQGLMQEYHRAPGTEIASVAQACRHRWRNDEDVRRWRVTKRWLENVAAESVRANSIPSEGESERPWQGTLDNARRMIPPGTSGPPREIEGVPSLDPDMPLRGGRLERLDTDIEEKMLLAAWQMIRSGDVAGARRVFVRYGQPWRAASLLGNVVLDDETTRSQRTLALDAEDRFGLTEDHAARLKRRPRPRQNMCRRGNPSRWLWKRACMLLSEPLENGNIDDNEETKILERTRLDDSALPIVRELERLIYASRCGNIRTLLESSRYCGTWDDHCWALFTGLTEWSDSECIANHRARQLQNVHSIPGVSSKDEEIKSARSWTKNVRNMLDEVGVSCVSAKDVSREVCQQLRHSKSKIVKDSAISPMRKVQSAAIMGMYRDLIEEGKCDEILGGSVLDDGKDRSFYGFLRSVDASCGSRKSFFEKRSQDFEEEEDVEPSKKISTDLTDRLLFAAHLVLYLRAARKERILHNISVAIREKNLQSLNRVLTQAFLVAELLNMKNEIWNVLREGRGNLVAHGKRIEELCAKEIEGPVEDPFFEFHEMGDRILEAYTWQLETRQCYGLVTLYMSQISRKRRVRAYAAFLHRLSDMKAKEDCVNQARTLFSEDVSDIVNKTATKILEDDEKEDKFRLALAVRGGGQINTSTISGRTTDTTTLTLERTTLSASDAETKPSDDEIKFGRNDLEKLRTIYWLCVESRKHGNVEDPIALAKMGDECIKTVGHANRLMRDIVSSTNDWPSNIATARKLLVGYDVVDETSSLPKGPMLSRECVQNAVLRVRNVPVASVIGLRQHRTMREHKHWVLFVRAHDSYLLWRRAIMKTKPSVSAQEASSMQADISASDDVTGPIRASILNRQFMQDNEDSNNILRLQIEAVGALVAVLHATRGWLLECAIDEDEQKRLDMLRRANILNVVRMYHEVLFETSVWLRAHGGVINRNESKKLLMSSLEVASKVADERFELHKTMSQSGIISVLRMAQRSALELHDMEGDSDDV